ncbi:hypothetical protein RB3925 [Rhodopirellula baltica SH 1]|uniref:Uncharacterized protein n=1 Tax=Rhodopirellula baltica (strain DSM 10527 / NCIMB 13988 / SH1) TaxID=243090 RepID=Q7UTE8_RHOBA|nr:hypothetical protein RB3925 [Rhodopirellula baltica SH 1]
MCVSQMLGSSALPMVVELTVRSYNPSLSSLFSRKPESICRLHPKSASPAH